MSAIQPTPYVNLTCELVGAYAASNALRPSDLVSLIQTIHRTMVDLSTNGHQSAPADPAPAAPTIRKPAAPEIARSVDRDGIVSFIDGRRYKMLKRHLRSHGFTPNQYRERYGLPDSYPMVAENYAERRSKLAKRMGLGVPGAQAQRLALRKAS